MGLKERLFGPVWESKDVATRRRAVATAQDPRLLAALPDIARMDADAGVRLAALQRLDDEAYWLRARAADADPEVIAAADRALSRQVCEQPAGEHLAERLRWLDAVTSHDVLRQLAAGAMDVELRRAALARITAQGFLGDCVVSEPDPALAAETLARIDQVSTLKRIARELRGRSKQRLQAVLQRLAELEGDEHRARDVIALQLIQRVEQLARGEFRGDRAAELQRLQQEWAQVHQPDAAQRRRFDGAVAIVRRAIEGGRRPVEQQPAPPPEVEAAHPELDALVARARQLATRPAGDDAGREVDRLISEFDRFWNTLRRPSAADRAARTHFMALAGELQARHHALGRATATVGKSKPSRAADDKSAQQARIALERLLDAVDEALEGGDIAAAHERLGQARAAHDRLPKAQHRRAIEGRLGRMAARLKEMRDWQHWSNNKLRERLIERVGEIEADKLHPDAVTERLKELRERWKDLEAQELLPGDTRKHAAPRGQWRRFQAACRAVFEQARPALQKRDELRKQSLNELRDFLAEAERVCADESIARDTLIRYRRAARAALRNLSAIPPQKRGEMAGKLKAQLDAISARIDREFEAIETAKRRLIAEARKLVHEQDRSVAITRAKALQAEWKRIGAGRRRVDQQLWREFRAPIDPLFEAVQQERDRDRQLEHEHAEALRALCERAEQLGTGDLEALEQATGPMAGLVEEFGRYGRVPPALRQRFDQAVKRWRKRLEKARRDRARAATARIEALARSLQQAWSDRVAGKPVDAAPPADLDQDATAAALLQRLARIADPDTDLDVLSAEVAEHTARARQVVIEMECLSGLETPAEDKQQRMDYQIQRLSHRLGEGAPRTDLETELAALRARWIESFPHDPDSHGALKQRYEAAARILDQMTARP